MDADHPLVVMADLGQGPSLADVLLGDDAEAAEERLLAWARELGKVAVRGADRQREYDGTRRGYDPSAVAQTAKDAASVRFLRRLPSVLAEAGLTPRRGWRTTSPRSARSSVTPIRGSRPATPAPTTT